MNFGRKITGFPDETTTFGAPDSGRPNTSPLPAQQLSGLVLPAVGTREPESIPGRPASMTFCRIPRSLLFRPLWRRPSLGTALVSLVALGSHGALAQGITNPAGGGVIPVALLTYLGVPLLAYLAFAAVARTSSGRVPAKTTGITLVSLYVLAGFIVIDAADHFDGVLYLYLELLLVMLGMVFVLARRALARALGVTALVAFVVALNYVNPTLVDFQDRRYVDNENDFVLVDVSYPGHWREMHLEDGRVLLNINPHRQYGGTMRLQAERNAIESPIAFPAGQSDDHPVVVELFELVTTGGTWGWKRRPRAFFSLPVLGTVLIPRFETALVGTALVLDEDLGVDCRYLYEARGQAMPESEKGRRVTWTREQTVEDRSEVGCQ